MNRSLYLRKIKNLRDQVDMLLMESMADDAGAFASALWEILKQIGACLVTKNPKADYSRLNDMFNKLGDKGMLANAGNAIVSGWKGLFGQNTAMDKMKKAVHNAADKADGFLVSISKYSDKGWFSTSHGENHSAAIKVLYGAGGALCLAGVILLVVKDKNLKSKAGQMMSYVKSFEWKKLFNAIINLAKDNPLATGLFVCGLALAAAGALEQYTDKFSFVTIAAQLGRVFTKGILAITA